ncbi:MAG: division/cell wall cluster transcriptional repressor MraZ [Prevotella sp.]|nr:division/cell wall cluster transcriptional repressor MraZ [Prevotella sp.]
MRFLGSIEAKTDAKGRVFLPATFRKVLQTSGTESLVMNKDSFQDCLVLYPQSVWDEQVDLLRSKLNRYNAEHQNTYRQFVMYAESVTLDGNGRFLIPKSFLQKAGIAQEVKFVGMGDTIEIWSPEKLEASRMDSKEFGQALESIMSATF